MDDKKYVFLDLDGTLLNDEKKVCEKNKAAIKEALLRGHHMIVTTGRPLHAAIVGAQNVGLNQKGCYILAYNGGLLYDCTQKSVIYRHTLPIDAVRYLFQEADKYQLHIQTYCQDKVWCNKENMEVKEYYRRGQMPYEIHEDVVKDLTEEPCKCLLISYDETQLFAFQKDHFTWEDGRVYSLFSCKEYLEYMPLGVSKGNGIRKMSELLNFPMTNTIAIGDERNDISMIQAAHIGVCMKNGLDSVKETADYITAADNNEGGVAEALSKYVL